MSKQIPYCQWCILIGLYSLALASLTQEQPYVITLLERVALRLFKNISYITTYFNGMAMTLPEIQFFHILHSAQMFSGHIDIRWRTMT